MSDQPTDAPPPPPAEKTWLGQLWDAFIDKRKRFDAGVGDLFGARQESVDKVHEAEEALRHGEVLKSIKLDVQSLSDLISDVWHNATSHVAPPSTPDVADDPALPKRK
jgi:hypothetical protein